MTLAFIIGGLLALGVLARVYRRRRDRNDLRVSNLDVKT